MIIMVIKNEMIIKIIKNDNNLLLQSLNYSSNLNKTFIAEFYGIK